MKFKQLLTKSLLAAVCLLVGQSVWGAPTSYLTTWTGTVGTDNSADLYYGTKKVRIAAGESYVYTLKNLNDEGTDTWHNWVVEGNSEGKFFDCCANGDNWPFGDGAPTPSYAPVMATTDVADFMTKYNGATVTITISRNAAGDQITVVHTSDVLGTTDGNTDKYYGGTYTMAVGAAEEWDVYITQRYSHFEVTNVVYTESDGTTTHTHTSAIEALPFNRTWIDNNSTYPFVGGDVVKGKNVNAFRVSNTTATAYFDSDMGTDGKQPYTLGSSEEVTVSFKAFHGWLNTGTSTVQLLNSEGVVLVSYTFDLNTSNVTDVKLGGVTATGFEGFSGRSYNTYYNNADRFANGFDPKSYPYLNDNAKNPTITMKVSGNGYVSFNLERTTPVMSKTYSTTLTTSGDGAIKMDIASIKIIDTSNNSDRSIGINNLSITSVIAPTVTFKYADTDETDLSSLKSDVQIKSETGTAIEDLITNDLKTTFYSIDTNTKYVYSTFSAAGDATTVPAEGITVTLKFAPHDKYSYTVTAVDESNNELREFASGTAYSDEGNLRIYYPKAIYENETWYMTNKKKSPYYGVDVNSTNKTVRVTYTANPDMVFYVDGEDVTGATVYTTGTYAPRTSNGKTGVLSEKVISNLGAGAYKVTIGVIGKADNAMKIYKNSKADENLILSRKTYTDIAEGSAIFILDASTNIVADGGYYTSSDNGYGFDYIYIEKASVSATIGAAGWATLYSPYALNFAEANPSGLKAYTATTDGVSVTLTPVDNVPANTGVVLEGSAGNYSIPVIASSETPKGDLQGSATEATACPAEEGYTYYILTQKGEDVQFNPATSGSIAAGKAFLKVAKTVGAKALSVMFANDPTGIATVNAAEVAQPAKRIVNGQLVIEKNGKRYNAAGAEF